MSGAVRRSVVEKLQKLSWVDRFLIVEAAFLLVLAAMVVAAFPFRLVGRFAAPRVRKVGLSTQQRIHTVERVRWAVLSCARRLPTRSMCFEQGLAAQRMLRRRGISSVLYFGAAPGENRKLAAHVWVRDGELDVIGCENAEDFPILARFPHRD